MRHTHHNTLFLAFFVLLSLSSCARKPFEQAPDGSRKPQAANSSSSKKSQYTVKNTLKLDVVSVLSHSLKVGNDDLSLVFVPTLRISKIDSDPLPLPTNDLWIWVLYMSGTPEPKEIEDTMLYELSSPPGEPEGGETMSVLSNSPLMKLRGKKFRFHQIYLEPKSKQVSPGEDPRPVMFSMLAAPDKAGQSWKASNLKEISFLIPSYGADMTSKVVPHPRGVAAISLCAFEPEFVVYSRPLVLSLDGRNASSPGQK